VVLALVAGVTTWVVVDTQDDAAPHRCHAQLPTGTNGPAVGDRPPTFVLRSLDGSCVDLAAFRGRPIVVNFWASWCHPCRDEFPMFRAASEKYGDAVEIIGVVHDDIPADARRFARQQRADWPLLVDETDAVYDAYGGTGIPETFFIARDGTVNAHLFGLSERDFKEELRRILAAGN
jgi:cytochrome c biogenesis protein CcmG, thiol:disulfide interchange protein DsbE